MFGLKGEKLLKELDIKTKPIKRNKDIIEAENFSAIIKKGKVN